MLDSESVPMQIPCSCGGTATRVWVRAPGVGNKAKGKFPYFDTQLGITLESPQHRERVAKERGLVIMGAEEHERTIRAANANAEPESMIDGERWRDAAEKAWNDMKYGNVPMNLPIPTVNDLEVDQPMLVSQAGVE